MAPEMQNPAVQGRASRDMLGGSSHSSFTALTWRAQHIASRFSLSPSMARQVSSLLFRGDEHEG